jgi:hypothetical protein
MGAVPYQEIIICICAFFSWYYVGDSVRNLFNLSLSLHAPTVAEELIVPILESSVFRLETDTERIGAPATIT